MSKPTFIIILSLLTCCNNFDEGVKSDELRKLVVEKYDNDKIKSIGYKVGDEKVGEWREFRRERLFSIKNYKEGLKHGKEISYESCTGKILEEGQFDMGVRTGIWYWYSNGEIVTITNYIEDESLIIYHNVKFSEVEDDPLPPDYSDCY